VRGQSLSFPLQNTQTDSPIKGFRTFFAFSRSVRSLLFWDVMQRRLVVSYRRFGTTCRYHPEGSSSANLRLPTACTPRDESYHFVELISHSHPVAESVDDRKLYLIWLKRLHSVVLLSRAICSVSDRFYFCYFKFIYREVLFPHPSNPFLRTT